MTQVTYEFLARWNIQTGALQGAHCKNYDTVTMREGDAESVAVAGANGFPLSDILTAIEQGAIVAMDAANESVASKDAEIAALTARITELEAIQQAVI